MKKLTAITFKSLLNDLNILDENIQMEAARQPILFVNAARYRVAKMRKRSEATFKLEYLKSRIAQEVRSEKSKLSKRVTNDQVREYVETDKKYLELKRNFESTLAEEELAKLVLKAYEQRASALKIISDAQHYEGGRESARIEYGNERRKMTNVIRRLQDRKDQEEEE